MAEGAVSILIASGETSGDTHAAGLVREMKALRPGRDWQFFGSGGPTLEAQGVELLLDVSRLEAIGPWAALANARDYWRLFRGLQAEARRRNPALAILVDFPDFNLPLARRLRRMNIPVCYFISPQVWAWRKGRIGRIRRDVDLMLVIFPFEEAFYRANGVEACYIGNPTARRLALSRTQSRPRGVVRRDSRPLIALLPGSRAKEVELILPVMLDAASEVSRRFDVDWVVQRAPSITPAQLEEVRQRWAAATGGSLEVSVSDAGSEAILGSADCALVKSGTSTLEALLLGVPFAMVYKLSPVSWWLLKPFVESDTYCLANLVAGRRVVPEFVQREATGGTLAAFLLGLLGDDSRREHMRAEFHAVAVELGTQDAYQAGARQVLAKFFEGDRALS